MRKPNYEKYPSTKVEGIVVEGWENILDSLGKCLQETKCLAIDLYPGVIEEEVLSAFQKLNPEHFYNMRRDVFKSEEEVVQMTERFMTDDVLFGFMAHHLNMKDFIDAQKLENVQKEIAASTGTSVVVGSGAALVAPRSACIVYIPKAKKESMSIYLMFIQHIMYSLNDTGKAAVVVPTGFITAQSGIEKKIREAMIDRKMLRGVVSMPSNIFASTGTNVSVLFLDKEADPEKIVLVDASKLGETVKEGKNQRTVLTPAEEQRIVDAMNRKHAEDDFSVVITADEIKAKNYSFSAGQYFEVKIEYVDITAEEFAEKMKSYTDTLDSLFAESHRLEEEIKKQLGGLRYE